MPDDGNVNGLIEKLGRAFEEFKTTNDAALADLRKGKPIDPLVQAKLDKIDADLDQLSDIKAAVERANTTALEAAKLAGRSHRGHDGDGRDFEKEAKAFNIARRAHRMSVGAQSGSDVSVDDYKAYREIFPDLIRKGKDSLDMDRKAMSVGVDPDGGFLVPPDTSGQIVTRVFETSPMRSIASVVTISTDSLEGLRDIDEAGSGGWVGETQARPETTTPQLGMWKIPVHEQYANPAITQKMLDDSAIDIEAWLADKVGSKLGRSENTAFVTGNGVAKPRGFADYTTAATPDATRAWGVLEHLKTGVNGAFAASNPSDLLFDMLGSFKDEYLPGARWVTRRSVITLMRKFRDGQGQYLWIPGLISGASETMLGYPITKFEDLPALSTNGNSLWFGDFRRAYLIVDRTGIRTLRDPYTNKPFVMFYTTKRVGGDVIHFEAIKAIQFAA